MQSALCVIPAQRVKELQSSPVCAFASPLFLCRDWRDRTEEKKYARGAHTRQEQAVYTQRRASLPKVAREDDAGLMGSIVQYNNIFRRHCATLPPRILLLLRRRKRCSTLRMYSLLSASSTAECSLCCGG